MVGTRQVVVGAAIVRDGRVLACRRTAPPEVAGRWELPGGKVEPGEVPEAALVREVREELGCDIAVTSWLAAETTIGDRYVLRVAVAALVAGEPDPVEHDAVRWLGPDELGDVDWLDPDRPFLLPIAEWLETTNADPRPTLDTVTSVPDERLLLVHAHPDDETIQNGATMAKYVAMGRGVTLVTCTAGEMGEILVPELEHLAADREDGLGEHRRGELDDAMKELGVTDHRFLGGFGTYRDSGMQWHADGYAIPADETHQNAFWNADLREAADHLVAIIREIRPQVLLTYDQFGNYGHPDHIQAHRVATYAASLAAVPSYKPDLGEPWDIPKVYWSAMAESRFRATLKLLREAGDTETFSGMEPDADFGPFVTPDEHISARVDGSEYLDTKLAALARHRSQVETDGLFFRGSENGQSMWGEEFYRIAKGTPGPVGEDGWESDLFSGL